MPELPEVESVRIQLRHALQGSCIERVEVLHSKSVGHDASFEDTLRGKCFADIERVGKLLIFSFVNQADFFLLAHLKMTGQFFYVAADELIGGGHSMSAADVAELPGRHTRIVFHLTDKSTLYFNDMRLFGFVRVANKKAVEVAKQAFGPEPIADTFDCEWFRAALKRRQSVIKAVLLDQSFVAGLGNIYVDEALFRAGVRPTRRANTLTKREALLLCKEAGAVMKESIAVGGTTFQHFKDTQGEKGNFTQYLQVFGKQGSVCVRCGATIKKVRVAGRGTHYCPGCQR